LTEELHANTTLSQLWGEQYSEKISDLMSLQREIASKITSNLRLTIFG
jgi:TolB-like protein